MIKVSLFSFFLLGIVASKGIDQNSLPPINPENRVSPAEIQRIEEINAANHIAFPRIHAAITEADNRAMNNLPDVVGRNAIPTTEIRPPLIHNRIAQIATSDSRIVEADSRAMDNLQEVLAGRNGRTIPTTETRPPLPHNRIAQIADSESRILDQSRARAAVNRRVFHPTTMPRSSPLSPMSPRIQEIETAAVDVFERLARFRPQ